MAETLNVITGATGLLGSHIAELLIAGGEKVRALVRPTTDVSWLTTIGVEIALGDIQDSRSVLAALQGASTVYHCASRVGDFGTWKQFQADVVDSTRNVMAACRAARVERALHVSSVAVYGHRPRIPPGGLTEAQPLARGWRFGDHYGRAKVHAELAAHDVYPEVTIVRPTWMIGPRDRHGLPRLVQAFRRGWVSVVGSGENLLNIIHVKDVAEGAILAAKEPNARSETYNLCSSGEITQREFLDAVADTIGSPRVRRRFPIRVAYFGGLTGEIIARLLRLRRAPFISRYTVARLGRPAAYPSDKAKADLGWCPRISLRDFLWKPLLADR